MNVQWWRFVSQLMVWKLFYSVKQIFFAINTSQHFGTIISMEIFEAHQLLAIFFVFFLVVHELLLLMPRAAISRCELQLLKSDV